MKHSLQFNAAVPIVQLYIQVVSLECVIDTSAIIAVLTGEPSRAALIRATKGADLVAPASVHWEIGNALVALIRRRLATLAQAGSALNAYAKIPLRLLEVDLNQALHLADEYGLYAYDAYLLACALNQRAPLLTLDKALTRAAMRAGVELLEVKE